MGTENLWLSPITCVRYIIVLSIEQPVVMLLMSRFEEGYCQGAARLSGSKIALQKHRPCTGCGRQRERY